LQAGSAFTRGIALFPLPALGAVIFLASSRGGVATAIVGTAVFVVATVRRATALLATACVAAGSAGAIGVLIPRDELVNGPLTSAAAASQGRSAAFLIALCCALTPIAFGAAASLLVERLQRRRLDRAVLVLVGVLAVAVLVLGRPGQRFDEFKRMPSQATVISSRDFVKAHLLSGNGSGRWQFWSAAWDEFTSAPLVGRGAGSYEAWWAEHASFSYFIRNAHSLYLEVLGELGAVGFLLLAGAFATGIVAAVRRLTVADPETRITLAALTGAFAAFAVGGGIDWVWQLTVVGVVGMTLLALIVCSPRRVVRLAPTMRRQPDRAKGNTRLAVGGAVLFTAWLLICAQAIPWLSSIRIADSQAAVRSGDRRDALKAALDAKRLQPWAATPYLQLALVEEELGNLGAARRWIADAIERDPEDWRLWLVSTRLATKSGDVPAARASLAEAKRLNPRSSLLSALDL
jgi:hypothetical protein